MADTPALASRGLGIRFGGTPPDDVIALAQGFDVYSMNKYRWAPPKEFIDRCHAITRLPGASYAQGLTRVDLGPPALPLALAQHVDHHVEGARELADLVAGAHRDVGLVVVARLERVRRAREALDRLHDGAREKQRQQHEHRREQVPLHFQQRIGADAEGLADHRVADIHHEAVNALCRTWLAESAAALVSLTILPVNDAGTAAPFNFNGLVRHSFLRRGPNVADVQVNLVGKGERSDQSHAIAKRIRPKVAAIATSSRSARNGTGSPI